MQNKTALITGASRGIGRAIALRLAADGFDIAVNYTSNKAKAEEVKEEIEKLGRHCTLVKVDLRDADCAEKITAAVPTADVLVLNASIQHRNHWDKITISEFDDQINCNLRSSMLLMQKYAPKMAENHFGRIITIGSVQERKPHADMLVYSASKAALTAMAKSISLQLAGTGVTVNSVAPGVIGTDRNTEALSDGQYKQVVLSKIPCGVIGKAEDCAGIVSFLCRDEANYITGQNIFVDGGMGIK